MSKRQATIASFFVKKEVPSPKREAIEPTAKRRKVERRSASPAGDRPIPTVLDESYPPPTHPSYHPPPTPTYNHPITIAPIPDLLNSSLAYNTDAKPIVKPDSRGLLIQQFQSSEMNDASYIYLTHASTQVDSQILSEHILANLAVKHVHQ